MTEKDTTRDISRRTLLKGTATTGAITGLSGTAAGKYRAMLQELNVEPAMQDSEADRRFALLGIVGGWTGIEPAEVDSRTNPPLRMVEGREYEVFWVNGDGNHHNFNLRNENGDIVKSTPIIAEQEATQTVKFTAEPGLAEYFCAPHPVQMRGPIEFIEPSNVYELTVQVNDNRGDPLLANVAVKGPGADAEISERFGPYAALSDIIARGEAAEERGIARFDTLGDGTYTVTAWTYGHETVTKEVTIDGSDKEIKIRLPEVKPGKPDKVYKLTLHEGFWRGEAPDEIAGKRNPPLTVTPGKTYRVRWTNTIGRRDVGVGESLIQGEPLPGHNFVVARENMNTILRSEFLDEPGETQIMEFVAEEGLGVYLDQSQLEAIGEIDVEESNSGG